jgi:hypothetical protein
LAAAQRLLGETYVFRPGQRRVLVVDHELGPGGRTGRLVVTPEDRVGHPFAVNPEDLDPV